MHILKTGLIFIVSVFLTIPLFANNIFYEANKNLERVGLKEILAMDKISLEEADFRLDPDFTLGYGDSVAVNFWGKIEANYNLQINRDGNIIIPFLGKINIVGFTLNEAKEVVRENLDKKFTNVKFDLALANVQNIRVTVLGNVKKPGPYTVNPFCRVAEVVARAGGPNDYGTLIDIKLMRNDEEAVSFSVYDFIFKGDMSKNVRLKHGDMIFIPMIKNLIAIKGDVIYPGIYEARDKSRLKEVVTKAGSITPGKAKRKIYVLRIDPEKNIITKFTEVEFDSLEDIAKKYNDIIIDNHDIIIVTTALDYNPYPQDLFWEVSITGKVKTPGVYLIEEGEKLGSLLKRAGGIIDTAFLSGMVFMRESLKQKEQSVLDNFIKAQEAAILKEQIRLGEEILTPDELALRRKVIKRKKKALELFKARVPSGRIAVSLEEAISGKNDIVLEQGDKIHIPGAPCCVLVTGAVYYPGAINFTGKNNLDYYLNLTGGINRQADSEGIYIIKADGRAIPGKKDYDGIEQGDTIIVPLKVE